MIYAENTIRFSEQVKKLGEKHRKKQQEGLLSRSFFWENPFFARLLETKIDIFISRIQTASLNTTYEIYHKFLQKIFK